MPDSGNNAGAGYPVHQVVDGNLTAVDVYGNSQYGTITARNFVGDGSALTNLPSQVTYPTTIAEGGTGKTTQAAALTALAGTQTAGDYLRSDGTNTALAAIQAGDVPTLNQNTSGTAAGLSTPLVIASGGTGGTTAATARVSLGPFPENYGVPLTTGEASCSRLVANAAYATVSQGLILTYWVAATTQTAGHIITYSNSPAQTVADCTLAELAVFAVNTSTGALTSQLAITANLHATLYGSTFTAYTSAFTSSWSQVAGTTYCVAQLVVASGGLGTWCGAGGTPTNAQLPPILSAYVSGQASMPGSVAAGSIAANPNGNQSLFFVMTP